MPLFLVWSKSPRQEQTLSRGRRQHRRPHAPELTSVTPHMLRPRDAAAWEDLSICFLLYHYSPVTLTLLVLRNKTPFQPHHSLTYIPVPFRYKSYQPEYHTKKQQQQQQINKTDDNDVDDNNDTAAVLADEDDIDDNNNNTDNDDKTPMRTKTTMMMMMTTITLITLPILYWHHQSGHLLLPLFILHYNILTTLIM